MNSITVSRVKLLEILRQNRAQHRAVFEEAMVNYRQAAIVELDAMIADAKAGKKVRRSLSLAQPMDATADYDRVIAMLEMTLDDKIALNEQDFRCYVQDKWNWGAQFAHLNKRYTSTDISNAYIAKMEGDADE